MKKFIYSLSLAMAFGFAANAVNADMSMQKATTLSNDVQALQIAPVTMELTRISPETRKAKRGAVTAQDFIGTYKWSGRNQLQGVIFPNEGVLSIEVDPNNPSKMLVVGFDAMAEPGLEANFDEATGRLYIPNQFTFLNTYYNQDVWFVNWTVFNGTTEDGTPGYGLTQAPDTKQFYFTLTDNGIKAGDVNPDKWDNHEYTDEELQDVCCIACNLMPADDGGYFWMVFGVTGETLHDFTFVEDQWQQLGNAEFTDAWFPIYWEQTPTYDVPLYYDKSHPGRYMLYDPYGYGGEENPYVYYGLNISDKPGYLIFDITDPECIVFEPLVYGITIDMRENEEDDVLPQALYCFNLEGYNYYLQGASREDIVVYFDQNDLDISHLNQRTNEISIYNAVFTMGLNATYYTWQNFVMEGSIVLPPNYMDAVDTVLGEDANVPAVYYNLQGQRVNNPEKGQLLIVKKGNHTTKQIIR